MNDHYRKLINFVYEKIKHIKEPNILEFGVREGVSTKMFIKLCEAHLGNLYSIDTKDCKSVSKSKRWNFIQSRDDNFDFIKNKIPEKFDIIFLDTLHEAQHVKKIFYYYYKFLKTDGFFFIDDTSWLPYVKKSYRDGVYAEINNQETFEILLKIYFANYQNFDLEFSFVSSGFALAIKLNNNELNSPKKIPSRKLGIKNLMWKILK
jgi:predicted O-methyltransferase YrrM